ncbi:MAG: LysR family transcriptional regulator [Sandaracinaceae bacterium]|nr:LysR family transcriptional regulator [Sandaracinaceae bacterium]
MSRSVCCVSTEPDLNLLVTLDVLLAEGSVTGAARRLRLSASAMSRALSRLRATVGDPLLVRKGRGLVPTPRAMELRAQATRVVTEARAVLRPAAPLDPRGLRRAFTLRTTEGFVETFGATLLARVRKEAAGVQLRFVPKADKDPRLLREGVVDLETGVVDRDTGPELRTRALFRDHYVAVVREGHPLTRGRLTQARWASGEHVAFSRQGDDTLTSLGLERDVVAVVGGFGAALALARASDLVATVPALHTAGLRGGMVSFPLPFETPQLTVSMLWHQRLDADPAHRWLRRCVRESVERTTRAARSG